ncbi:serine/threonine-protein kinase pakA-like [Penaeus japonicus]|uniref:serine/threonine-protein kinase pakA-like n=1 Tax=Penaeus japonicus TaxID=27405 RepID=UPI001C717666|nr:serine/threonine-protein kinase pakA-like [Penaeus japonicus]XP_042891626.1 serine/threonine-protein kinase pakA-like [Penaeus japonicus]
MPGPILSLVGESSDDLAVFESCEDVQEAWACRNGNYDEGDRFEECCNQRFEVECRTTYTNGGARSGEGGDQCENREEEEEVEDEVLVMTKGKKEEVVVHERRVVESRKRVLLKEEHHEKGLTCLREDLEEMECEEEEEEEEEVMEDAVEAINTSVVEAKINLELSGALTRQKIGSLQMGRTLSYADKDDAEEPPTRRPRPLAHARESIEFLYPELRGSSMCDEQRLPAGSRRGVRVARNPSYQAAMRGPSTLAPPQVTPPPSPGQQTPSSSCEGSPVREGSPATVREKSPSPSVSSNNNSINNNNNNNDAASDVSGNSKRNALGRAPPAQHAANMPRSASFSGSETPIPDARGSGSLSQGNSRAGSVSPLPSASPRRNGEEQPSTPVRGSVITRSFRKLFSTPTRTLPPPTVTTTAPPEDYWIDVADAESPSPSESRSSSRLRRISSSLSRRLSTRSKMSTSSSGSNGQFAANGTVQFEDCRQLVEYEDLLKLFICSGCQITMVPPLHQCRKGHLVCNTCRASLKQVCPVCRQRFAESTNLMMEQVCQLIKFPCRFSGHGCPEFHPPKSRSDHEHFCSFRPVHCHHGPQGCPKILRLRDMHQHLDECEYKAK